MDESIELPHTSIHITSHSSSGQFKVGAVILNKKYHQISPLGKNKQIFSTITTSRTIILL